MRIESQSTGSRMQELLQAFREPWPWRYVGLTALLGSLLALLFGWGYVHGGWQWLHSLVKPVVEEGSATVEDVASLGRNNGLPTLYFDIPFEGYQHLAAVRERALERGVLIVEDGDWTDAEIRYGDRTYRVRLRLKGDWTDHLGENKWSFRVEVKGGDALMGFRTFAVQSPATRRYLNEWLYHEAMLDAGLLVPRYGFVNVVVNGEDWGVYAIEEGFSKELLESQGRRESVIVRFDESLCWTQRAIVFRDEEHVRSRPWYPWMDPQLNTFEDPRYAFTDEFQTAKVQDNPVLRLQSETAKGMLRAFQNKAAPIEDVFDEQLIGAYLAYSNLWGARHSIVWHNQRYYYNPLTSQLEPIAYDALPLIPIYAQMIDLAQYDSLPVMAAYVEQLKIITRPEYLDQFIARHRSELDRYRAALAEEFPDDLLQPPWDTLAERQTMLWAALHPEKGIEVVQTEMMTDTHTLRLTIANTVEYPLVLDECCVEGYCRPFDPAWVESARDKKMFYGDEGIEATTLRSGTRWTYPVQLSIPLEGDVELSATTTLSCVAHLYTVNEPLTTTAVISP